MSEGASRLSAVLAIQEVIEMRKKQIVRLGALLAWMETTNPPVEVEELIWSMVTTNRGGYYI